MIKVPTREDALSRLFYFLEQYGMLEQYSNRNNPNEDVLYQIGKFILEEQDKQSKTFACFVELVKGQLISRAVYLQYYTTTPRESKMQKCKIFLDTALLLSLLGLKTEAQNNIAREFLSLLPKGCELLYFPHTLDEVRSAIRKYMYVMQGSISRAGQTIEGFVNLTLLEVEEYYKQIEHILGKKGIKEWQNDLPNIRAEEVLDEAPLKNAMDTEMKYGSDIAKQNDINAAAYIKRMRRGKIVRYIENCNVFFITHNIAFARLTKQYACHPEEVSFVITEQDFTVAMWLKSSASKQNIPRSILVSNAMAAVGRVADNFIDKIKIKFEKYKKDSLFTDDEAIQLMIEDNGIQQELIEETFGDVEMVTPEMLKAKDIKYREKIENDYETATIKTLTSEIQTSVSEKAKLVDAIKTKAKVKANIAKKRITIVLKALWILLSLALLGLGVYYTVTNLINDNLGGLGFIILILFGGLGFLDLLCKPKKFITKFIQIIANKVYDKVFDKETIILVQVSDN
jgi:hypothetical protein